MLDSAQLAPAMNCHLVVPRLFWPATADAAPSGEPVLPALEMLMSRGERTRIQGGSLERWLGTHFCADCDAEPALAPFAVRGEGCEPGEHGWLRADPVHLRIHADRVVLAEASRLAITADESRQLVNALNAHFSQRGIAFVAPHPERWYARVASAPQLRTTPTAEVAGQDIAPHLPNGAEQAHWRGVFNEAQMLLHGHPCNDSREQKGQPTINSLWFWGTGADPQPRASARYHAIWSDDPLARGLALASDVATQPLPDCAFDFISTAGRASSAPDPLHLVVLPPVPGAPYGDADPWRGALSRIEQKWFAPLLQGVFDGALSSLTLHALGPAAGCSTFFTRAHRLRLWRRRRRFSEFRV